jgi:hypothetical protein
MNEPPLLAVLAYGLMKDFPAVRKLRLVFRGSWQEVRRDVDVPVDEAPFTIDVEAVLKEEVFNEHPRWVREQEAKRG